MEQVNIYKFLADCLVKCKTKEQLSKLTDNVKIIPDFNSKFIQLLHKLQNEDYIKQEDSVRLQQLFSEIQ